MLKVHDWVSRNESRFNQFQKDASFIDYGTMRIQFEDNASSVKIDNPKEQFQVDNTTTPFQQPGNLGIGFQQMEIPFQPGNEDGTFQQPINSENLFSDIRNLKGIYEQPDNMGAAISANFRVQDEGNHNAL